MQLPDLSGPVQQLVEAQLAQLRLTAPALAVRIAHALTRAAIYQETPLSARRVLHARAATLVSGRGAVLDHRRAAAKRYDDELATELEDVRPNPVRAAVLPAGESLPGHCHGGHP